MFSLLPLPDIHEIPFVLRDTLECQWQEVIEHSNKFSSFPWEIHTPQHISLIVERSGF